MARLAARERLSFGKLREVLALPDLIAVQRESFEWFLSEGVAEVLRDISPIEDFTGTLHLSVPSINAGDCGQYVHACGKLFLDDRGGNALRLILIATGTENYQNIGHIRPWALDVCPEQVYKDM